jgi:starch-binding outer membrane protein SusE/F
MKTLYNIFSLLLMTSLFLPACKKDEERAVVKQGTAPVLAISSGTIVLDTAKRNDTAVKFSWNASDFGYQAAVNYTLQLSKKGASFASASTTEVSIGAATAYSFTVADFNRELLKIVPAGQASDLEARIKAEVGTPAIAPAYSNAVTFKATPFRDIINYPSLWVTGNFQGWAPASAPKISSKANNGIYEGYIFFNNASPEFKLVKGNDWSAGDYGSAGGNKIQNGGANLTLPSAGHYRITANTTAMTWSYEKINSWGVIGDATPGGWTADTDLVYNPLTGAWSITLPLLAGKKMKFRANGGWDINFGDNEGDSVPDFGASDIVIPSAGTYIITLDLSVAGNYSYTLKKL